MIARIGAAAAAVFVLALGVAGCEQDNRCPQPDGTTVRCASDWPHRWQR